VGKVALITGIAGQDGSFLAELLLSKGYRVHGMVRRSSLEPSNMERISHILPEIEIHEGDLLDQARLSELVAKVSPDELYALAAQSHVGVSFKEPVHTAEITGLGALRILEAVRHSPNPLKTRVYQAGSSEEFGDVAESPQSESTVLRARSPYGAAKIFAHHACKVYREAYGMHVSVGVLFNHESEHRGLNFVTRKITHHVAMQALGITSEPLVLGNLDSKRDWGHAEDYVRAMWLMLQQDTPDDYVIATGETHTVREFVEAAYRQASCIEINWSGIGTDERGLAEPDECWDERAAAEIRGKTIVCVSPEFYRPADVETLTGDASKARRVLGWKPEVDFRTLVKRMVLNDMYLLQP